MKKIVLSGLFCLMASVPVVASGNNNSKMAEIAKAVGNRFVATAKFVGAAAGNIFKGCIVLASVAMISSTALVIAYKEELKNYLDPAERKGQIRAELQALNVQSEKALMGVGALFGPESKEVIVD